MFKVGDKVILINDAPTMAGHRPGTKGDIFTVLAVETNPTNSFIKIDPRARGITWRVTRFILLDDPKLIANMILSGEINDMPGLQR